MSSDLKRPVASFAVGGLSVALWENTFDNDDGTERTFKSVSLRRSYFNRKENRFDEQTITINPSEVGCVRQLLARMEQAVIDERAAKDVPV